MLKTSLRRRRKKRGRGRRGGGGGGRRRRTTTTKAAASLSRRCHNKYWLAKPSTQLCCHLCSSRGQRKGTQCARCDVGPCVVPCFVEYHTKVNL